MIRHTLKQIFQSKLVDTTVLVKGRVRSVRKSKQFSFIALTDGTCQAALQIIAPAELGNYDDVSKMLMGTSIAVTGKLVPSQGKGQTVEMQATNVDILGRIPDDYPLQKKDTSLEFLRENAHVRGRTNTFGAVFRIRSTMAFATHRFFQEHGFFYFNAPLITANDGEGAGQMFQVSTLDLANPPRTDKGKIDFSKDFFGKPVSLTVTGQLEAEAYAHAIDAVYTFGPTFRAENSYTPRHLSEFWMVEPEAAFVDLDGMATIATDYIKALIGAALDNHMDDLEFLQSRYNPSLIETLTKVRHADFIKITYTEAIHIFDEAKKNGHQFEFPCEWGADIQTEHEKYLTDVHFKSPVIVTDYPKAIKAFYMKHNPDGKTVRAMDILVPGIGEIIGGSQREDNYEKLIANMTEKGIPTEGFQWYLDLRRFGTVPSSGFGLGFERAIMYVTGMTNIRDVIPFPRSPMNCEF